MKKWLFLFCLLVAISSMAQNSYQPHWESLDKRPVPTWFENAKFGIFIHWGCTPFLLGRPKGHTLNGINIGSTTKH